MASTGCSTRQACPQQHQTDPTIYDRVNRGGTANMLAAAHAAGVKRVIYTSTIDIFAAERGGTLVETRIDRQPKPSAYPQSKVAADLEVERMVEKGLDVVHICPSAVYGPGPVNVVLNAFFVRLLNRQSPALPPGGMSVVYVDGLAKAHLAADERLDACLRVWLAFVPKIHPVARDFIRLRSRDQAAARAWSDRMTELRQFFRRLARGLHEEKALAVAGRCPAPPISSGPAARFKPGSYSSSTWDGARRALRRRSENRSSEHFCIPGRERSHQR